MRRHGGKTALLRRGIAGGLLLLWGLTACVPAKSESSEGTGQAEPAFCEDVPEAEQPAIEAPAEEEPAEEAPAEEEPAEEAPAEEEPAEEEPAEEEPAEEAPAEEEPKRVSVFTGKTHTEKNFEKNGLSGRSVVDPYRVYSPEQMRRDAYALQKNYPALVSVFTAGYSVEGRPLVGIDFGRGKREIIVIASMHACEHISTNVIMYLIDQYCQGYEQDGSYEGISYRQILDNVRFRIMPMANPDGVNLAQNGLSAVRNQNAILAMGYGKDDNYSGWKSNIRGVDLNGNFEHKWGIRDEVTAAGIAGWCGPKPLSEPESVAMQSLLDGSDYYMFLSLHIRGEVVYWIDTDTEFLYARHYATAKRFAEEFDYTLLDAEDVHDRGGYIVNTARVQTGKFCATIELCPYRKDPYPPELFPQVVDNVYSMLLIAGDEALKLRELGTPIDLEVNGRHVPYYRARPVFEGGTLLVPAQQLIERCGIERRWDEVLRLLILRLDGREAVLPLGGQTLYTSEGHGWTTLRLEEPLQYRDGSLMLPVVPTLEALGFECEWDESTQTEKAIYNGESG